MCDSDPCYNGGTCHGESGMAKCECPAGYDGRFCELSKYTDGYFFLIRSIIKPLRKLELF